MSETETVLTEQEVDAVRRAREAADAMPLASNAIGDLYAMVRRLDAELTRLRNALPETADGVTVVPGMTLWGVMGDNTTRAWYPVVRESEEYVDSDDQQEPFDSLYASREVAVDDWGDAGTAVDAAKPKDGA